MINSDPFIVESFNYEVFSMHLRSDGIYKIVVYENTIFNISDMEYVLYSIKRFGYKKMPILIICNKHASTNVELMNYLAKAESNPYSLAEAYVLTSYNQTILANFYLKFVKPARPTSIFSSEEAALKWLNNYKIGSREIPAVK